MKNLEDNFVLITTLSKKLKQKYGLVASIGAEIEFYLKNEDFGNLTEKRKEKFYSCLSERRIKLYGEKAEDQYEVAIEHTNSLLDLVNDISALRTLIKDIAYDNQLIASFKPKPFKDNYGSSMHFHLSLHKETGDNVFTKEHSIEDNFFMKNAIAGILSILNQSIYFITGTDSNEYLRLYPKFMAPINISWGGNNRTTAVRIPDSSKINRRIEFRVPSANCNPENVIIFLLIAVLYGLYKKPSLTKRIYGNAYDPIYNIPKLPRNVSEAIKYYSFDVILQSFLC